MSTGTRYHSAAGTIHTRHRSRAAPLDPGTQAISDGVPLYNLHSSCINRHHGWIYKSHPLRYTVWPKQFACGNIYLDQRRKILITRDSLT
jgi:hypothetical protein